MSAEGRIPLVDLGAQYRAHKDELDAALRRCLESTSFIGGPDHEAFGRDFADFCGGGSTALCGNGTDALALALRELLGPGDGQGEVVTVSHTFVASVEAIELAGWKPRLVDVRRDTGLLDPAALAAAIGPRTRAILPVHLYGQMVDMEAVCALARRHSLPVIEDAAQAHGATWAGKGPGQWGDAACFSFYPGKNLGAWGDGGAVVSRDADLIARIKKRADHGRASKYLHELSGTNSRLDGLQAAVLRVKLRHLKDWNEKRRRVAGWYDQLLTGVRGVERMSVAAQATPVFHLYVVLVEKRDEVLAGLKARGVDAGTHYPVPVHEQPAFRHLGLSPGDLPVTHDLARRCLSLPIYAELERAQAERVVAALLTTLAG